MLSPQSLAAPSGERESRLKAGWCCLQVKLCDPCLSGLRTRYLSSRALYKSTYLYLYLLNRCCILALVITCMEFLASISAFSWSFASWASAQYWSERATSKRSFSRTARSWCRYTPTGVLASRVPASSCSSRPDAGCVVGSSTADAHATSLAIT